VRVALGVSGCIAAYKAVEVMRGLQKAGVSVQAVLTRSALNFVGPLTFEALSGREVITEMFATGRNAVPAADSWPQPAGAGSIEHIRVAQQIDLLVVAPATANVLAKFAQGIADDFLTTLYISTPAPVLLAPAMNVEMWNHPAVRENVARLRGRGHRFCDPEPGMLACGMEGEGRLAEVDAIVSAALDMLAGPPERDLAGLKVLVTAGPTVEDLDPVRFISNRSSGRMGYAIAEQAARRGAEVVLVSGPTQLAAPAGVRRIDVRSAAEMQEAVLGLYSSVDVVIKAAAVSDFRPAQYSSGKIKKAKTAATLELAPNPDILASLGAAKRDQILVGFAAETENVLANARGKLEGKNLDLIVANDVSTGVFGAGGATVHILSRDGESVTLADQPKSEIARRLLDTVKRAAARPHPTV
jgi:phosphopantothenoylcysteine decarboxylase/phosphopantothenate--cysteine ligase